jgi:hypothetical protein
MANAYVCIARNDLPSIGDGGDVALKITDLKPNSVLAGRNINGSYGQTGGIAYLCDYDAVTAIVNGGGFRATTLERYGMTGYLLDTIHSDPGGGNTTLSNAHALAIAAWVAGRVSGGLALTAAAFNAACTATTGGATGIGVGNSTATLEQILRIASGEIYVLPAGVVSGGGGVPGQPTGGAFVPTRFGYFATAPEVQVGTDVRGRSFATPTGWGSPVVTPPQNTAWRNVRTLFETGDLHRSLVNGQLSKVTPAGWVWTNPEFTYGGAGTALTVAGAHIAASGAGRACTVYDATGHVL